MSAVVIIIVILALLAVSLSGAGVWYFWFREEESTATAATGTSSNNNAGGQNEADTKATPNNSEGSGSTPQVEPYRYTEIQRRDWVGNDIGAMNTDSVSACELKCDSDPTCKAFFAKMPGGKPNFCWLKSAITPESFTKINPGDWNDGSFFVKPGVTVPAVPY